MEQTWTEFRRGKIAGLTFARSPKIWMNPLSVPDLVEGSSESRARARQRVLDCGVPGRSGEATVAAIRTEESSVAIGFAGTAKKKGARNAVLLAVGLAIVVASAPGCVTDPYTGERRISKAFLGGLFGGGIGAGVAAGIAALAGKDEAKAALIGFGSGVLTGAAVGGYMDYQDAKLREFLEGTGVRVVRVGNEITLSMPSNITFRTDSDLLSSDFLDVMHGVSLVLVEYDKTIIEIMGHTDATGSHEYNVALSRRRAGAVGNHLATKGINPLRILTEGFGEDYPIAPNDTVDGRALNRRVELRLSPLTNPEA